MVPSWTKRQRVLRLLAIFMKASWCVMSHKGALRTVQLQRRTL